MSQLSHTRRLQGNRSHTAEAEPGQEAIFEAGHTFYAKPQMVRDNTDTHTHTQIHTHTFIYINICKHTQTYIHTGKEMLALIWLVYRPMCALCTLRGHWATAVRRRNCKMCVRPCCSTSCGGNETGQFLRLKARSVIMLPARKKQQGRSNLIPDCLRTSREVNWQLI